MTALIRHRDRLLEAAGALFRYKGYAATGLSEILSASGAPKGSFYHYFPEGKVAVAEEALRRAGQGLADILQRLAETHSTPGDMAMAYGTGLAQVLQSSGFRDGCPVGTLMLEMAPDSDRLTKAGCDAFSSWSSILATRLAKAGIAPARAVQLADFTIAAFEGALILARVQRNVAPVLRAAEELRLVFEAAMPRQAASPDPQTSSNSKASSNPQNLIA